jgi:hypothetical protein
MNNNWLNTLYRATLRATLFLFFFLIATLLIFGVGDYQDFLDIHQQLILRISEVTAFFLMASSIFCIIEVFLIVLLDKKIQIGQVLYLIFFVVTLASGIAASIFSRAIVVLSNGF